MTRQDKKPPQSKGLARPGRLNHFSLRFSTKTCIFGVARMRVYPRRMFVKTVCTPSVGGQGWHFSTARPALPARTTLPLSDVDSRSKCAAFPGLDVPLPRAAAVMRDVLFCLSSLTSCQRKPSHV